MAFDTSTLITNRTQADVDRVRLLSKKGVGAMTQSELSEFLSDMRGAYNAADLNRVESAVAYLADFLRSIPAETKEYAESIGVAWDELFDTPYNPDTIVLTVKTNWGALDVPCSGDLERYLSNVAFLQASISVESETLPESIEKLSWDGANAIERVLFDIDIGAKELLAALKQKIDNTKAAAFFSGEVFSGEV